ncbi:(S)-ureidoglycine aminohydrolase [Edaphobacter bradus]|uniref:(S)-ureidoglycine aminohydrolase n=1 Tax=Edaphobacter bradus TaxID=2259016 RepID=UPI0021E0B49C|nr:(S)-ureidoglycine aminohydrolase [Edaphobacter bradus]
MHNLGHTRSTSQRDHLLHTPDTFVRAELPGMKKATAVVHISPAGGAAFTQYTAEFETDGVLGSTEAQRFLYVLEGAATLTTGNGTETLSQSGYAYLPAGVRHQLKATSTTRVAVIEKPYKPLSGAPIPEAFLGEESAVASTALNGDPDLQVRALLPGDSGFDFAVNTMTYSPGAALSMVEVHVMEHGLLMLEGGGIYRLGDSWYPVTAGDFIWMAPYCPQWFGAIGKKPAKYLIYKDWNRHPLS